MDVDNGFFNRKHITQYRVYYEDTDAAGVVYHSNYLKYAERARTDALREIGVNQSDLMRESALGFVVKNINADYISPARLDDIVTVETSLRDFRQVRFEMQQKLKKGDLMLVDMLVEIAIINSSFKPTRISKDLKERFLNHFEIIKE